MLYPFDLVLGIPGPAAGVQCADQGITLNSKELLFAEAGSASLTSMILLCSWPSRLALLCKTWHQQN